MGEYARHPIHGPIKIGTCEDMYYLRHSQCHEIVPEAGSLNPAQHDGELRFRFPFPDEDTIAPGQFQDYARSIPIPGMRAPTGVEHFHVQFRAPEGYLVALPCPETLPDGDRIGTSRYHEATVHRNGFGGAVRLCQQKPTRDGAILRAVFTCGGCGAKWRADTWADAEPYVVAIRAVADREQDRAAWWHALADRLAAGYPDATAAHAR